MRIRTSLRAGFVLTGAIADAARRAVVGIGGALSSAGGAVVRTVTNPRFWLWPF